MTYQLCRCGWGRFTFIAVLSCMGKRTCMCSDGMVKVVQECVHALMIVVVGRDKSGGCECQMLQQACESSDVGAVVFRFRRGGQLGGDRGGGIVGTGDKLSISPVDELTGVIVLELDTKSGPAQRKDLSSMPIVFGSRIDAFDSIIDVEGIGWQLSAIGAEGT